MSYPNGQAVPPGGAVLTQVAIRRIDYPLASPVVVAIPNGHDLKVNILGGMTPLQATFAQVAAVLSPALLTNRDDPQLAGKLLGLAESWARAIEDHRKQLVEEQPPEQPPESPIIQ